LYLHSARIKKDLTAALPRGRKALHRLSGEILSQTRRLSKRERKKGGAIFSFQIFPTKDIARKKKQHGKGKRGEKGRLADLILLTFQLLMAPERRRRGGTSEGMPLSFGGGGE